MAADRTTARYIAVEGPIGVGKTALARRLATEFGSRLLLEQVEENPFLRKFYEDPDQHALQTQLFFLLERYLLFSQTANKRISTGQVHHIPYPIQPASLRSWKSQLHELDGLPECNSPPDHVAYSPGVDVEVFPLR